MKSILVKLGLVLVPLALMGQSCSFNLGEVEVSDGEVEVTTSDTTTTVEPEVSSTVDAETEEEVTNLVTDYYFNFKAQDKESMLATVHPLELEATPANLWHEYWDSQFADYGELETYSIDSVTSEEFPDGSLFVTASVTANFEIGFFTEELTYAKLPGESEYLLSELSSVPQ